MLRVHFSSLSNRTRIPRKKTCESISTCLYGYLPGSISASSIDWLVA